jgi:hypothetical protein
MSVAQLLEELGAFGIVAGQGVQGLLGSPAGLEAALSPSRSLR